MCFEVIYTYVYTLYHVQEIRLKNKGFSRVVQHSRCVFELLKIVQTGANLLCEINELVLSNVSMAGKKGLKLPTRSSSSFWQASFRLFPPCSTPFHPSNIQSTSWSTKSIFSTSKSQAFKCSETFATCARKWASWL